MGFVKAFNFAEIKELTQPISKPLGLLWFITFLIFISAIIQYLLNNEYWWLTAIIGILVSQTLVITFWQDAKFGTIPNVIIFLVSIIALATLNFDRNVSQEIDRMFSQNALKKQNIITADMIAHLPAPVQKWITNSGLIGKERIYAVRLKQKAFIKMKPEQEEWSDAIETDFLNPNSAVDFIKLKNGHLLLVYNDNMNDRTPLTVAVSTDGDKTYPFRRDIAGGDNTFAYPYAIQTRDGKIHIIYTTNNRTTIMHAVFDEFAIIGSPPDL
jgi:hypothetical protein